MSHARRLSLPYRRLVTWDLVMKLARPAECQTCFCKYDIGDLTQSFCFQTQACILAARANPVRNFRGGGAIALKFGGQVSLRVHYCKRDEVHFVTVL